jgi:hypothetical protein
MTPAERERLIQLMGMTGSHFDGEAVNALRLAGQILEKHKLSWRELLANGNGAGSVGWLQQTNELLQQHINGLEKERDRLRRENERLRLKPRTERAADGGPGNHRAQARWILELWQNGEVRLNQFEQEFLDTVQGWEGPLTAKQRPIFDRILHGVVERTGQSPP